MIIAEGIEGIIHAGERQHAVKQIRAAEEQVRRVHRAHRAAERHDRHLTPVALAREVANLRHHLIDDVVEPALMLFDALARVAAVIRPRFVVDGIDGEHHDFARVDIRAEHVVHVEIFEIIETPCLTGNEQHRLAAMAVDLELHFAVQVVGIAFVITNFHGLILLIHSWGIRARRVILILVKMA